jgi:S-adenosylmethionine-diacylgycerolhomoserine-N-methlytransferase
VVTTRRYTLAARFYDRLAAEWVYRPGRVAAIEHLRLRPGEPVLDVGCGTGLNFALLLERVGPDGLVVGVSTDRASGPSRV